MDTDDEIAPVVMITGSRVALGPWQRAIVPLLFQWNNDLAVSLFSGESPRATTLEQTEALYEEATKAGQDEAIYFVIYDAATLRPIGWTGLTDIDLEHRVADYHIVIGVKEYWGTGYGTETTRLMLDYAFNLLGLHNVLLVVLNYNERALQTYTRAGFTVIGRRRASHRIGTRAYDDIYMECLATEFQSPLEPILRLP